MGSVRERESRRSYRQKAVTCPSGRVESDKTAFPLFPRFQMIRLDTVLASGRGEAATTNAPWLKQAKRCAQPADLATDTWCLPTCTMIAFVHARLKPGRGAGWAMADV